MTQLGNSLLFHSSNFIVYLPTQLQQSIAMDTTSRGGRLDDDFISTDNHQGSPHSSEDSHSVGRLSDVSTCTGSNSGGGPDIFAKNFWKFRL